MEKQFETLHERMMGETLDNGLRIYYFPKPGFSKTFAVLATDFGSVDESFTLDGVRYDTPTGVAHFLEHKMFEDVDGNALQKFAATGASPNAFTSHTMTAYHFTCTDRFEENLEILLKFVYTPYFTDENVEKEKGIIGQEIGMMDDTPDWQAMVGMYEGMYHEHPVRRSIAGSVESISHITPEILYACHKAFYSPCNMALVVVGTADFNTICNIAREYSPKESTVIGQRHYGARQATVNQAEVVRSMQVSMPTFMLGLKDDPVRPGESRRRRAIVGDIALRLLCGKTSPLYTRLYESRLINASFDSEYSLLPEAAGAVFGGESQDPRAVRDALLAEAARLAAEGVDGARFRQAARASYGMLLRALDSPDEYARLQAEACFGGEDLLDFPAIYDTVTAEDVQGCYTRWSEPGRASLSIVEPRA
ncbi:insulinase family protein [Intestinibacillus massiliensis]|nr:insulinase family protein [Intestinibacillus massiliensis]